MTGITGSGTTVWLPIVGQGTLPHPARPQFGVGVRVNGTPPDPARIPVPRALELLCPPCFYTWSPWAGPGWLTPSTPQHIYHLPGFWPHSWNPPADLPDGTYPDMAATWMDASVAANPGAIWLIGNEPVRAAPPYEAWCPPARMADHCTQMQRHHGVRIAPFGGIATQRADYEYGNALRRQLQRDGTEVAAWHWHVYPENLELWYFYLNKILTWSDPLPVIISETNYWPGSVDDNRRLMDRIIGSLRECAGRLLAVFWYVSWEPSNPGLPNAWQLLDRNAPDCRLTATGRHYKEVT